MADTNGTVVTEVETLAPEEQETLRECEAVIERGLKTYIEVGTALRRIRDERLYRATHKTFEDYCRARWDMSRQYAYRQIQAATAVEILSTNGNTPPANEAQARAIAPLVETDPEAARQTWQRIQEKHNGRTTARFISRVLEDPEILDEPEERRRTERNEPTRYVEFRPVRGSLDGARVHDAGYRAYLKREGDKRGYFAEVASRDFLRHGYHVCEHCGGHGIIPDDKER